MKKVTIADIAKVLDTNPSTVSRALSGNTRVSQKMRELVAQKALEMGYTPNEVAASLRKGKNKTIGMIVPRINRHFFSNVISGVEQVLKPRGYSLIICQSNESEQQEREAVDTLLRNRVGGIIVSLSIESTGGGHFKKVESAQIPLVQFDRVNMEIPGSKIVNSNRKGAYDATAHLIRQGYTRIAHFTGTLGLANYEQRFQGYKQALADNGIPFDPSIVFGNTITRAEGQRVVEGLLPDLPFDAIFSSGDYSALGALEGLKKSRVASPGGFGIVGFANEPFAELIEPSLSSVEQNGVEMGKCAAEEIVRAFEQKKSSGLREVCTELILRESSNNERIIMQPGGLASL